MPLITGFTTGLLAGGGAAGIPTTPLAWLKHPDLNSIAVPTSFYGCQEASGNLIDAMGLHDLSANGTPDYQQTTSSKRFSIYLNGSEHFEPSANTVWDVSTGDITMLGLCYHGATSATERGVWGKKASTAASSAGYAAGYRVSTGSYRLRSADGTTSVSSNETTDQELTWETPGIIIDQSGTNTQTMWSSDGSDNDSIAAVGSLTNIELFQLGRGAALSSNQIEFAWFGVWDGIVLTTSQLATISTVLLAGV